MENSDQRPQQGSKSLLDNSDFAAVLRTEDQAAYRKVVTGLVSELQPSGLLERMLVGDIAHATWEMMRFARLKAIAVEVKYYDGQKAGAQKRLNRLARSKRYNLGAKPNWLREEAAYVFDRVTEMWLRVLRDQLARDPDETDYAISQQACMPDYVWLEGCFATARRARDNALSLLDEVRAISAPTGHETVVSAMP